VFEEGWLEDGESQHVVFFAVPFNGRPRFERNGGNRVGGGIGNGGYLGVGVETFVGDGIPA
jgi:hypothetical protein